MALYLVDTNVLLRSVDKRSSSHPAALQALYRIANSDDACVITPQNIIEFWAVASRPESANGLGWTREALNRVVSGMLSDYELLSDTAAVFERWLALVRSGRWNGKRVHDARLVAVMQTYGVTRLLTFNTGDFADAEGIEVISPTALA